MPAASSSAIDGLRRRTVKAASSPLSAYHDDPVGFARDLIEWPAGQGLTPYQVEGLSRLQRRKRLAVRGPHGLGKTTKASVAILWFATTRDEAGEDWKIPTTASAWLQLTRYLWPEVHKWAKRLRWDRIGRDPFTSRELLDLSLKLEHGEAFSASPADAATIEGAHATQLLYVYDEAKNIPDAIFDATEGAFSTAGTDTEGEAFALAISTPGEPVGRFYDISTAKPGTEDWDRFHVTKAQAIAAGRMSAQWAAARARQWGTTSAVYQNRVEGEFASSDEDSVIPLAWIELAQWRWRDRFGDVLERFVAPGPLTAVGVDCSSTGTDRTVLARRYGTEFGPLERPRKIAGNEAGDEEMATAGRTVAILRADSGARAVVDAIGIGSSIVGAIRQEVARQRVEAFNASEGTNRKDRQGELGFTNKRSAAWWAMREALDPDEGDDLALPPDDMLTGDLTAPHWKVVGKGLIQVESKDEIRKRLGRSTDSGDAVIQAWWDQGPTAHHASASRLRVPTMTG